MSRALRTTVALVALTGLLGTTALGAANAVHVAFEHEAPRSAHAHHSDAAATEEGGHHHESAASTAEHAHAANGEVHRSQAPGHRHPPALVADVQARTARTAVDPAAGATADAPATLGLRVDRPLLEPTSRAGPVARTAPLCRRSVVLQV